MDGLTTFILIGLVFSMAALLQGFSGFGFSLLAVPILSLLVDPKTAVPFNAVASSITCIYLAWVMRKSVTIKPVIGLLLIILVSLPFGILFLRHFDREVILLREWENHSFAEIGGQLGITEDAARMRFHRALARLAEKIQLLRGGRIEEVLNERSEED